MGNRVELDEMGKRILDASRTELYLSMRFLGPALHSLGWIMDLSTAFVGTDAVMIRFNPNYLFQLYVNRPRFLNRTYLHMILHCVFRHMFTAREKEDRELWDLASDIAVDAIIDSMEYRAVAELTPEYRQKWYSRLEEEIHVLTAERIYQYFIERKRNYLEEMQLAQIFAYDDHSFWERMEDEEEASSGENSRQKDFNNSPSGNTDSENDSDPENDDPDSKKDPQTGNKGNNKEENKEKKSERNTGRRRPAGRQDDSGRRDDRKDPDRRNGEKKRRKKR